MKFLKKKEFNDENLNKGATSAIDFDIICDFRFFDISIVLDSRSFISNLS